MTQADRTDQLLLDLPASSRPAAYRTVQDTAEDTQPPQDPLSPGSSPLGSGPAGHDQRSPSPPPRSAPSFKQRVLDQAPVVLPAILSVVLAANVLQDPMALLPWLGLGLSITALVGGIWVRKTLRIARSVRSAGQAALALLDRETDALIYSDGDGRVVIANDAGQRYASLGSGAVGANDARTMQAGLTAYLSDRINADYPEGPDMLERLIDAHRLGVSETVDLPLRDPGDPDGEPEWVRVSVSGHAGATGARLWRCRDVTARRAIDEVMTREQEELADFLYFLPVGLYSVDADGRIRYVNQRLAHWLGREPDSLTGQLLDDWVEGDPPDPDGEWEGMIPFRPDDDQPFLALLRQATYDDAGDIRTRSVVLRLPERPEPKGEGGWARRRPWLFDGAPVGIGLIDPDGLLTDCNESFLDMVGRDRDLVLDRPLDELVSSDHQTEVRRQVTGVLEQSRQRGRMDLRLRLPEDIDGLAEEPRTDERERAATVYLSPMVSASVEQQGPSTAETGEATANGQAQGLPPEGVVVHMIDVTERKNLEHQFAQAQKMQAMGQLAGGVAHDFNNLLTAMIGFADLLLQRHGQGDPSFADIMQIKQNANRAANLVRQLLAFSRRQPLRPRLVSVVDGLSELSHLLRRLLGERIELKLAHGREPGHIRVDPGQFDQVIINLAVNARDAMGEGGVLTISTRHHMVTGRGDPAPSAVPQGDWVVIDVADTGEGIARDNLPRLFEPFFTTKAEGTAGSGTGLGLSTVYGIVRQTDGYIFVDSTVGEGATFSIWLPRVATDQTQAQTDAPRPVDGHQDRTDNGGGAVGRPDTAPAIGSPPTETSARTYAAAQTPAPVTKTATPATESPPPEADLTGRGTILLVEDEDAVRVFGARALRNKGYDVQEARTGEGALELLDTGLEIDLLITDMVMPGMDGAALADKVRSMRSGLPIILISGYSEDVIQGDAVNQPNTHFLPKPFSLKQLAATVRDVLDGKTPETESLL